LNGGIPEPGAGHGQHDSRVTPRHFFGSHYQCHPLAAGSLGLILTLLFFLLGLGTAVLASRAGHHASHSLNLFDFIVFMLIAVIFPGEATEQAPGKAV